MRVVPFRSCLAIGFFARAGQFAVLSLAAPFLLDRGVPVVGIGWVLVGAAVGAAGAQVLVGRVGDRIGPWAVTGAGVLAEIVGIAGFVAFTAWPLLFLADLLAAAGAAAASNGVRTSIALSSGTGAPGEPPVERRFGRLSAAQTVGGLVGPLVVGLLATSSTQVTPWIALCAAVGGLISLLVGGRTRVTRTGAAPAGDGDGEQASPPRQVLRAVFPVLVLVTGFSVLYGINGVAWGIYLRGIGAPNLLIAWSFVTFSLPMIVVSPIVDRVLPSVPRWRIATVAVALLGVLAWVYASVTSLPVAVTLTLLEGTLMALSVPVAMALVPALTRSPSVSRAFGYVGAADSVSTGVGSAVSGVLIATSGAAGAFRIGGVFCVVCAFVAAVAFVASRARTAVAS